MKSTFFTILGALAFAVDAYGFELVHVDYGQELYFVFDGGTTDGVLPGMTACVDDQDDEEVYCAKIAISNTTRSGVYAPLNQEAWLETGARVRVKELGNIPANLRRKRNTTSVLSIFENKEPIKRSAAWHSNYVMTPILPFKYNHADFSIDARMSGQGSLWQAGLPVKSSFLGLSLGRSSPVTQTLDQEITLGWRFIKPIQKEVDYDPNSGDIYARETSKISDVSLSWDLKSVAPNQGLNFGWQAGVVLDRVGFEYAAQVLDELRGTQSVDLASSKATLTELSSKIGVRAEQNFGARADDRRKGTAGISANALMPLYAKTTWKHGNHNMPVDAVQGASSQDSMEEATNLAQSSVGLEANLYMTWIF